jgi:osmotically-inducible protein OsmY
MSISKIPYFCVPHIHAVVLFADTYILWKRKNQYVTEKKSPFVLVLIVTGITQAHAALAMSDKVIKQRIEDQAADTLSLRKLKVDFAVEEGYVVLYGTVGLYIQKMIYEQIAWKTEGVVEVDNEIRVVTGLAQSDAVIERKIMELAQTHRRLQGVNIIFTVVNGAVQIRTTLDHPQDVLFLKRRVAEIDGVIDINIQAKFIA